MKKVRNKKWLNKTNYKLSKLPIRYCKCGCGGKLKNTYHTTNNLYINGHNNIGKKFSDIHKLNMSKSMNKGLTKLTILLRNELKYKKWRQQIFERDDYTCVVTGKKGAGNLIVHHIKNLSTIIKEHNIINIEEAYKCKELWNINNGITLLNNIHNKFHNIYGRKNNTAYQIEEFKNDFSN